MSAKHTGSDSVWPAVERAIRGLPPTLGPGGFQAEQMREQFKAAIIRQVALELALAGVKVPGEC
jgi:hypothetical protein